MDGMAEQVTSQTAAATEAAASAARESRQPRRRVWLLVTPAVLLVLVVFCYPAIAMIVRSLTEPEFGLQNFQWLLGNDTASGILLRTLVVAGLATAICLLLGYPYAYLMSVSGPRARSVLTLLVLMPFWTSLMVRTFAWVIILQDNGILNDLLGLLGLPSVTLLRTTSGVLLGMCQILMPFMVLPLYAGMRSIDRRLIDAGHILGAPPWKTFVTVYFPLSLPGVFAGSLMVFILSLGFYITPAILGSPRQKLLPNALASEVSDLLNWGHGGALAVALLVSAGGMLLLAAWVSKRITSAASIGTRIGS